MEHIKFVISTGNRKVITSSNYYYSSYTCWVFPELKHAQIYVVRQLAYSTELLVCINQAYKQYKQQTKEEEKILLYSTQLSLALSLCFSLCFTLQFSCVLQN